MKLAVNFSQEAEKLILNNSVKIDIFKCSDFNKELIYRAENTKPSYIHFGINVGSNQIQQINWEVVDELRRHTQTPYVNVHAVAFAKDYPDIDILTTDPNHIRKVIDATIQDIEIVADKVGMENIILENVICRGKGENMMKSIIDPNVLCEIVHQTGCGFLLDIAHAQMTAICLGFDVKKYISQLPLNQLKELHITGIQADEKNRLRDSMPMTSNDWQLATWAIQKIKNQEWPKPWVVSFEYGGFGPSFEWRSDETVLSEQIPLLYNLIKQ